MVQERLLGQHHALAQHQQLQDRILLAGHVQFPPVDEHFPAVQVQFDRPHPQHRLAEPFAAPHHRLHPSEKLRVVERFDDEVVGAEPEGLDLGWGSGEAGEDQDGGVVPRDPQPAHDLEPLDIRQHEVEQDDVVLVVPGQLYGFHAGRGMVDHGASGAQHQGDGTRRGQVVFYKQDAHGGPRSVDARCNTTIACVFL